MSLATNLRTVKQAAEEIPWLTEAALRKMILEAEVNGLAPAIIRPGGRRQVLIDMDSFDEWLERCRGVALR